MKSAKIARWLECSDFLKYILLFSFFGLYLIANLIWSKGDLFYYGRVAYTWKMFYEDFWRFTFRDHYLPPGYFVLGGLIHRLSGVSIGSAQRIIDLIGGGIIVVLFSVLRIKTKSRKWWLPAIVGFTSMGFWSPLTSQGAEGLVSLFVIIGLYFLLNNRFFTSALFFVISIWFKFLFYFISPAIILYLIVKRKRYDSSQKRKILLSVAFLLIGIFLYNIIDSFSDIKFQVEGLASRNASNDGIISLVNILKSFFSSFISYVAALILGLPILILVARKRKLNLFFGAAFIALIFISVTVGYWYYYAFPVFAILFAWVFSDRNLNLSAKELTVVLLINFLVFKTNPYFSVSQWQPTKYSDYQKVVQSIGQSYKGGLVVIPLEFALEFPYRHYLLDTPSVEPETLKQTEWIVAYGGVPITLLNSGSDCYPILHSYISSQITLYKYKCINGGSL